MRDRSAITTKTIVMATLTTISTIAILLPLASNLMAFNFVSVFQLPNAEAQASEPFFTDDFDGSAIDSTKWNTDISNGPARWCDDAVGSFTGPGNWLDTTSQPCHGLTAATPYGAIDVTNGEATFSSSDARAFSYIWNGPPSSTSSIFPATGDFIFEIRMKYNSIQGNGDGIIVQNKANADPLGTNPPVGPDLMMSVFAGSSTGLFVSGAGGTYYLPSDTLSYHTYTLQYIDGEYIVLVDGTQRIGPTASSLIPNSMFIGNPTFVWWALGDWSDFTVDYVRVSVPPNQLPTANAGADFAVDEGTTGVQLQGSGSDADGTISSYQWEQVITGSEPTVTLANAETTTATFDAPSVTTNTQLTFRLTVTDNDGAEGSDMVVVTVQNVNQMPTADAGPDQTVNEGDSVSLDASGSFDPDGDSLTYAWTQTAGTSVTLSDASSATPSFTAPDVGPNGDTLTFELTVDDGNGHMATDIVNIVVENVNQAPTANADNDFSVNEGTAGVQLQGSGSDADGTISSYQWEQVVSGSEPTVTLTDADTATAKFDAPSVSAETELTFKLTVTDNDGSSASDTVVVTINNVNQAPTAELTANPTTIDEDETSALDASGSSDPDGGDSLTYSFAILNSGPGTITGQTDASGPTASYEAPADVSSDQTVTVQVTVEDGSGGTDTETVDILVKDVPLATQFTIKGFYAPVDMEDAGGNPIVNTIKSGRSVPMKFEVFDQSNVEQTSTDVIESFKQNKIACGTLQGDPVDAIEITNTGGTSLRYDTEGGTFIQNWKTPSGQAGNCYSVTVTTADGSSITAYFKLK